MKPYHLFIAGLGMVAFGALGVSCATPGTRPDDMSAAAHEKAARQEETEAKKHAAQYDPNAPVIVWSVAEVADPPREDHRAEAERYRRAAAEHRAASETLRRAEGAACVGLGDADRDMSPFAHREDIVDVSPLLERTGDTERETDVPRGAAVTFRAVKGLTAEWLQRIIDCHVARNAALGYDIPEMASCPLAVRGASARVRSAGSGFVVAIRAEDRKATEEILRRASALKSMPAAAR